MMGGSLRMILVALSVRPTPPMPLFPSSLIYVVDDDPAVLHSTCFLFESAGHRAVAFASGEACLTAFPGPRPAVVLLDQVMPGLDGIEVFVRLRHLDARVPVVLVTGHPNPSIRRRAHAAGIFLVEKPLALDDLSGLIAAGRNDRERLWSGEE